MLHSLVSSEGIKIALCPVITDPENQHSAPNSQHFAQLKALLSEMLLDDLGKSESSYDDLIDMTTIGNNHAGECLLEYTSRYNIKPTEKPAAESAEEPAEEPTAKPADKPTEDNSPLPSSLSTPRAAETPDQNNWTSAVVSSGKALLNLFGTSPPIAAAFTFNALSTTNISPSTGRKK